jgi:hypothetical protein
MGLIAGSVSGGDSMGRETTELGDSFDSGMRDNPQASDPDWPGIIEKGYTQFLRDLGGLLAVEQNHGKLAVYHGKRRICIVRSMDEIVKECARHRIPSAELMIEPVQPQPDASQHVFDRDADCEEQMNESDCRALTEV